MSLEYSHPETLEPSRLLFEKHRVEDKTYHDHDAENKAVQRAHGRV